MAVGMAAGVSSAFADDDVWAGRTSHPAVVNPAVPVADGSVLSLRGEWEFASCPNIRCAHMLGFQEATNFLGNAGVWAKSRTIGVPGCWDAQGVGEEGFGVGHDGRSNVTVRLRARHLGIGFYRRTVTVPDGWRGKRIWLKVGRINTAGWIWIDGEPVAQMTDAYRARKWDVTDLVTPGRPFEVMVEANNTYPYRNGQMLSYHRWGGIVRDIELEATPSCFIDDVWVRGNFDGRCAEAKVEVEGEQRNGSHSLKVTVEGETKEVGLRSTPTPSTYTLEIPLGNFRAWSPEHPNLYTAKVELVSADGRVMQTRFERFGVRKLEVKGEQFYLNDRPFYVRGFGDDSTYPITGFSPASKDFHLAHLKVARAAGFNYVRTHTHCELPEYFEAADEAGILVQPELHYGGDQYMEERIDYDPLGDAKAVTEACRRYVSYATLSGGNEGLHGPAAGRALYDWVKRNDPGRLVLEQDGGTFYNCHSPETSDYASGPMYMWERGTFNPRAFVCHEYANLAVKADARMEGDYTGAWLPRLTREMRRKNLAPSGLGEAWSDRLQDAQHDLQRFWARRSVECARKDPFCDGFIYWTIADYMHWDGTANTTTAQGLFDPFWRAKPHGTTPEAFAAVNGPTVILLDTENRTRTFGHIPPAAAPGKRFRAMRSDYPSHLCCDATSRLVLDETNRVYAAGERIPAEFIVSHYGEADLTDAQLVWTLAAEGRTLATAEHPLGTLFSGPAHTVAKDFITVPPVAKPVKATLTATLSVKSNNQTIQQSNNWIFWLFPRSVPGADPANVAIVEYGTDAVAAARREGKNLLIVGNRKGKRDIFLGWWALHWRCVPRSPNETQNGVAVVPHDVLGDFPYEPFLSPLLFGIIGQGTPLPVQGFEEKDFVMVGEGNYDFKLYLAAKTRPDGGREAFVSGLDLEAPSVESAALRRNVLAWLARGKGALRP